MTLKPKLISLCGKHEVQFWHGNDCYICNQRQTDINEALERAAQEADAVKDTAGDQDQEFISFVHMIACRIRALKG